MYRHLFLAAVFCGTAATAQASTCAMRQHVVDRLQSQYSEQLTAGGLQGAQNTEAVIEVWASPETGTFTVMQTRANGISCIVAAGTDWFSQSPQTVAKGTPS
jgi:hypothetical protein